MKTLLVSSFFLFCITLSAISQDKVPVPSIPLSPPTEIDQKQVIDNETLANLFGFPFTRDVGTPKFYLDTNYNRIRSILLSLYKEGKLESDRVKKTIDELYDGFKDVKIESDFVGNDGALQNKYPDLDVPSMMSAFILSAKTGYIPNIKSCLRVARCNYILLPGMMSISSVLPVETEELTKEQKLSAYPAAKAILDNPSKSILQLQETLLDQKAPEIVRLRAAAFLNELKPEELTKQTQSFNDSAFIRKLEEIKRSRTWNSSLKHLIKN